MKAILVSYAFLPVLVCFFGLFDSIEAVSLEHRVRRALLRVADTSLFGGLNVFDSLQNAVPTAMQSAVTPNAMALAPGLTKTASTAPTRLISGRLLEKKEAVLNGLRDLEETRKKNPLTAIGPSIQRLRDIIIHNPEVLTKKSSVLVFPLPRAPAADKNLMERGMQDKQTGNDMSPCASKMKAVENTRESEAEESASPEKVEALLQAMTLQERAAFDEKQMGTLDAERNALESNLKKLMGGGEFSSANEDDTEKKSSKSGKASEEEDEDEE